MPDFLSDLRDSLISDVDILRAAVNKLQESLAEEDGAIAIQQFTNALPSVGGAFSTIALRLQGAEAMGRRLSGM